MAENILLKYYDTEWHTQTFEALSVKGLDDPDKVQICGFQFPAIDGGIIEHILGFRRVITADLGVVTTSALRRWIYTFLESERKNCSLNSDTAFVVLGNPDGQIMDWQNDSAIGRSFTLELMESRVRTKWPLFPSDTMKGYSINHVKIEGTQSSPELFTTNSVKLQYRFDTTPFPDIVLDDYNVTFAFGSYSDAQINLYGTVSQNVNGTDIDFYLQMNDGAIATSDGYVYADITILMDAKA